MSDYINKLNEAQKKAVEIIDGPVMVFAGAGTGKTRTLTSRVAYLIESGIPAANILAITFTNKATNEMKDRLVEIVGDKSYKLTISTFHSLCARILRREITRLGYNRNFEIVDEEDQLKIINEATANLLSRNFEFDKKRYTAKYFRKTINNYKCFKDEYGVLQGIELAVFDEYEKLMKEYNLLDFEDLLIKTHELFITDKECLEIYRKEFQYILVDEFQDTNLIQYRIISLLAKETRNIFVVGDDDQSIYSFRGTNYGNIKLFKKDFPEYKTVLLEKNYRSTQEILKGTNNLISVNLDREDKKLYSDIPGSSTDVVISQLKDEKEEVNYVINNVTSLMNKGYKATDIAVLYRNTAVSRNVELGFVENGIPYKIYGGISYLRRKEVKDLIAYYKLIINHDDVTSFRRIINEPARGIGKTTIDKIIDFKKASKLGLYESILQNEMIQNNKKKILTDFFNMIFEFDGLLDVTPLPDLYDTLIDRTNYLSVIKDEEDEKERLENIKEFRSILLNLEDNGEIAARRDKLLGAFDEAILSDDKLQSQRQNKNGVTISTVHSVKGLEYRAVFVIAFEDGLFPNLGRFEDVDMEEERRIAYVACTRAKDKLFLTSAKSRILYGSKINNAQSIFLFDFLGIDNKKKQTSSIKKHDDYGISQINFDDDEISQVDEVRQKPKKSEIKYVEEVVEEGNGDKNYKVGDFVNHKIYGDGIIVSLETRNEAGWIGKICFTSQGVIKTFDMLHPAIKKKIR